MVSVTKFLKEKLGLRVNVSKSKVYRPNGINYLGFGFYCDVFSHQFKAKPHQISVNKLKEKLKQLTSRNWEVSTTYRVIKLKQLIVGWVNCFKISHMKKLCRELDKHIRFCLRSVHGSNGRKVKTRYKTLGNWGLSTMKQFDGLILD